MQRTDSLLVCDAFAVPFVRAGAMDHEHRKDVEGVTSRVCDAGRINMGGSEQHAQPVSQAARLDALGCFLLSPSSHYMHSHLPATEFQQEGETREDIFRASEWQGSYPSNAYGSCF